MTIQRSLSASVLRKIISLTLSTKSERQDQHKTEVNEALTFL